MEDSHERLLNRLERRKNKGSSGNNNIPMIPTPLLYYTHVTNEITKEDNIFEIIKDKQLQDEIILNWRYGQLTIPNKTIIMRLLRMPERHQLALLRPIGGDGTACGKLWAPSLIFPLFLSDSTTIISRNLRNWITSKNVLEVGAGWAGTPSLTAYHLGASHVAITDGEDVMVKCLDVNIAATLVSQLSTTLTNSLSNSSSSSSDNPKLSAHVLRWGSKTDSINILQKLNINSFDCILACDCIYDISTIMNLFDTITKHLSCNRLIFCWESRDHRYDAEEQFFQQLFSYNFRIKYFTSTLLSDLSYLTNYDEVRTTCNEIRSYLDSSHNTPQSVSNIQSSSSSTISTTTSTSSSSSTIEGNNSSKVLRNLVGNDLNLLFAERVIPTSSYSNSPNPSHSTSSNSSSVVKNRNLDCGSKSSFSDEKISTSGIITSTFSNQNSSTLSDCKHSERNIMLDSDKKQSKYDVVEEKKNSKVNH